MTTTIEPERVYLDEVARAIAVAIRETAGPPSFAVRLPWPPSVNHYWKQARRRYKKGGPLISARVITDRGKNYRAAVQAICAQPLNATAGRLGNDRAAVVCIEASPPDRRIRDLDNILKAPLDALAHARVFTDDFRIALLLVYRADVLKPGRLGVSIWRVEA